MTHIKKALRSSIIGYYLHGDEPVVHHHFLREEVSADRGFVLITEFLVHILVHQRSFSDTGRDRELIE